MDLKSTAQQAQTRMYRELIATLLREFCVDQSCAVVLCYAKSCNGRPVNCWNKIIKILVLPTLRSTGRAPREWVAHSAKTACGWRIAAQAAIGS